MPITTGLVPASSLLLSQQPANCCPWSRICLFFSIFYYTDTMTIQKKSDHYPSTPLVKDAVNGVNPQPFQLPFFLNTFN